MKLPEGKALPKGVYDVDFFAPSAHYTDKQRKGVAVRAHSFNGEQLVTVGSAFHKDQFDDGSYFHPYFLRGAAALTPDQADILADEIHKSAQKARQIVTEKVEPKKVDIQTLLVDFMEDFKNAVGSIESRLTRLEKAPGTPKQIDPEIIDGDFSENTEIADDIDHENHETNIEFEDPEDQRRYNAFGPEQLSLMHQLVEGGMGPKQALEMVQNAVLD